MSTPRLVAFTAEQIGSGLKGATSMDIYGGKTPGRVLLARVMANPAGQIEVSTPAGFHAQATDVNGVALILNSMVRRRKLNLPSADRTPMPHEMV